MFDGLAPDYKGAGVALSRIRYSLHNLHRDQPETLGKLSVIQQWIPLRNLAVRPVLAGNSRGAGTCRK